MRTRPGTAPEFDMRASLQPLVRLVVPSLVLGLAAVACGGGGDWGESDDLNEPGGDTDLDPGMFAHGMGKIAVEADESKAWVVNAGLRWEEDDENENGTYYEILDSKAWLVAVSVHGSSLEYTNVLDVSWGSDRRISFPSPGRAIYFEQESFHSERAVKLDTATLEPILTRTIPAYFTAARTSPSRRYIVANDQLDEGWRVALVNTDTLDHAIVPQDGFQPQGIWNRTSDRIWTVAMGTSPAWARVKRHRVDAIDALTTEIDIYLDGFGCDPKFDFGWVAVSPDDEWAVFPLWQAAGAEKSLVVVNQVDGTHATIPGQGPVGFTPGGQIVSYDALDYATLYFTDPATLETVDVALPFEGVPEYYTAPDGSWVVVSSAGSNSLFVYDWASGESTTLAIPSFTFGLDEFVRRPGTDEVWIASSGQLHRLDLGDSVLEPLGPAGFAVHHLNVLPSQDALLLGQADSGAIRMYRMDSREVVSGLDLPDPLASVPFATPVGRTGE